MRAKQVLGHFHLRARAKLVVSLCAPCSLDLPAQEAPRIVVTYYSFPFNYCLFRSSRHSLYRTNYPSNPGLCCQCRRCKQSLVSSRRSQRNEGSPRLCCPHNRLAHLLQGAKGAGSYYQCLFSHMVSGWQSDSGSNCCCGPCIPIHWYHLVGGSHSCSYSSSCCRLFSHSTTFSCGCHSSTSYNSCCNHSSQDCH